MKAPPAKNISWLGLYPNMDELMASRAPAETHQKPAKRRKYKPYDDHIEEHFLRPANYVDYQIDWKESQKAQPTQVPSVSDPS